MNSIILVSALALLAGDASLSSVATSSPVAQVTVTAARACFATHRTVWFIPAPVAPALNFSVFSLTPHSPEPQLTPNICLALEKYRADALGSRGQPA